MNKEQARKGSRETEATPSDVQLLRDAWGALNFILAFYDPGQRYLDTNAWVQAEAGGRRVHAALAARLEQDAEGSVSSERSEAAHPPNHGELGTHGPEARDK